MGKKKKSRSHHSHSLPTSQRHAVGLRREENEANKSAGKSHDISERLVMDRGSSGAIGWEKKFENQEDNQDSDYYTPEEESTDEDGGRESSGTIGKEKVFENQKEDQDSDYHTPKEESTNEDEGDEAVSKPERGLMLPCYFFEEDAYSEDESLLPDYLFAEDANFEDELMLLGHSFEELASQKDGAGIVEEYEKIWNSFDTVAQDDERNEQVNESQEAMPNDQENPQILGQSHAKSIKLLQGENSHTVVELDIGSPGSVGLDRQDTPEGLATAAPVEGNVQMTTAVKKSSWFSGWGSVLKSIVLPDIKDENFQLPTSKNIYENQVNRSKILSLESQKRQQLFPKSVRWYEFSTTGYFYDGRIVEEKMHGYGRLLLGEGDFISGTWEANRLLDLESCRLNYSNKMFNIIKRVDAHILIMFETPIVAIVRFDSPERIDFMSDETHLKKAFFHQIIIQELLQDDLNKKRRESLCEFESSLRDMTTEGSDPIIRANIFNLLRKYSSTNDDISDFLRDPLLPLEVRNAAVLFQTRDFEYRRLYNSITFLKRHLTHMNFGQIMAKMYQERITQHREMLIRQCPTTLPSLLSELQRLNDSKIGYITKEDIDVFDQLVRQPFFGTYKDCVVDLVKRFGQSLNNMSFDTDYIHPSRVIPIMSPVTEFLLKSLWEIISEIVETADGCDYESLLKCKSGDWEVQRIKWPKEKDKNEGDEPSEGTPSEQKSVYYCKALEVQCNLIVDILKRFFPDVSIQRKRLDFKFYLLGRDSSDQFHGKQGFLKRYWGSTKTGVFIKRFENLPKERLIWLYILDNTVHEVFKKEPTYQDVLQIYNPLFQTHVEFIERAAENYESFRALTHNVVKLVTSSTPYMAEDSPRVDASSNEHGVDVDMIFQKILTASQNITHDPLAFSNYRDLITEYNKYLSHRHCIETRMAPGYFSAQLSQIMLTFVRIVQTSMNKAVPQSELVVYFRSINDFLEDFKNIDFLGFWYIKTRGFDNQEAIQKVENKLSSGKNCSYRVTDIEKFVADYVQFDHPPPHHYIILIVSELLECIEKCLDKQWQSEDGQLHQVQLKTTGVLLDAIRRSFMYLKEQPDYVDFKAFKKESVEPFKRLVDECSSLDQLRSRASIVKESFWYLRKMDEIDIEQAMILLRESNTFQVSDELLNCYNLYLSSYEKYIQAYTSAISDGQSHEDALQFVKQSLKKVTPIDISRWTKEFKTTDLPTMLAGVSAIWSILISKDLSSTGKFLKPHCIQILCVLRLLSVDQSSGTVNHLAQVLTGQGKSVILGLLSSILALTGHNVRIICYSKYLSSRDEQDFEEFFGQFKIENQINYGTFEDMANEFLKPVYNGRRTSLRELVEKKIRNHTNRSEMGLASSKSGNTVLLIDEVDVFFTENFYGNTYNPCVLVNFRGLIDVQEKIWNLANTRRFTWQNIVVNVIEFIRQEAAAGNTNLMKFSDFLNNTGTFSLLYSDGDGHLVRKSYTNQTLFDENLLKMTDDAIAVAEGGCRAGVQFKIDNQGFMCTREPNNIYEDQWVRHTHYGYMNVFYYFKLKGSDYENKKFNNYGYLNVEAGQISYSRLPSQFRLILGVSGTLKNLNEYEKAAIESYKIRNTTILPSFYGESNLQFNEQTDFHYFPSEQEWLKKIYNEAEKVVQSGRAVLIFFESDFTMELFTNAYRNKFDRFNEITTNTVPHLRDLYIEEAGLPGAVTLATRGMGRGVDYKSSLSVEKHGGVHVIQTFYSTDIKEEVQIKGRTARKDNKGSYELVICKEHLVKDNIIAQQDTTVHNYATLDVIRKELAHKKGEKVAEKIKKAELNHKVTMEYFGLA